MARPKTPKEQQRLMLTKEGRKRVLHLPGLVAFLAEAAERGADLATDISITKDAEYTSLVQDDETSTRARSFILADNFRAVVDDHYHSTLMKTATSLSVD